MDGRTVDIKLLFSNFPVVMLTGCVTKTDTLVISELKFVSAFRGQYVRNQRIHRIDNADNLCCLLM